MEGNKLLPKNQTLRQIAATIVASEKHHVALLAIPNNSGECVILMTQDKELLGKSQEEITEHINKTVREYYE